MDPRRWSAGWPAAVVGAACIVAGGLVAAATAPAPSEHGTWAAAYLVLVAGVAQLGLVGGQALLAPAPPSVHTVALEFGLWNLGNAAVIAGTLTDLGAIVDVGGLLLVAALVLVGREVRGMDIAPRWPLYLFRGLVLLLLISIPVGLVLSAVRHP